MERIQVGLPDPVLKKLRRYAHKNDLSMSGSALKLIELALAIDSKKSSSDEENQLKNDGMQLQSDPAVVAKINELIVQNAVILKEILYEGFNFEPKKMDEIKDKISKNKASILSKNA